MALPPLFLSQSTTNTPTTDQLMPYTGTTLSKTWSPTHHIALWSWHHYQPHIAQIERRFHTTRKRSCALKINPKYTWYHINVLHCTLMSHMLHALNSYNIYVSPGTGCVIFMGLGNKWNTLFGVISEMCPITSLQFAKFINIFI
jgi:hypothetical protein